MLVKADGIPRSGYAVERPDGTLELLDVHEDAGYAHTILRGKRVIDARMHHGRVVPVLVIVQEAGAIDG